MFGTPLRRLFLSLSLALSLALSATAAPVATHAGGEPSGPVPAAPAPAAARVAVHGTLHAVLVGISASDNPANVVCGGWTNVDALAGVLRSQEGRLYEEVNITRLTGKKATAAAIRDELGQLRDAVKAGDSVVVYINAHGNAHRGHWQMAASDFNPRTGKGSLRDADVQACLDGLPCRVLLLLDSCFSGAFGADADTRVSKNDSSFVVYACCAADQYGWNAVQKNRSLFSLALVEALSGKADANGDGVVTLAEVADYVAVRVPELQQELIGPEKVREVVRRDGGKGEQTPVCRRPGSIAADTPLAVLAPPVPK
jgi:hypothetical protein